MKEGIYTDLSIDEYHSNRGIISSTGLKKAKRSTRDLIHYIIYGTESKPHFDFGNAFEIALMDAVNGTSLFNDTVAIMPTEQWKEKALADNADLKVPASSKVYRDMKMEFEKEGFGKYVLTDVGESESKTALDEMVDSCMGNPVVKKLLEGTSYQVSVFWKDPDHGVLCKTRPDICLTKKKVIVDIKTCKDASPSGFARDASNLDYPLQATMQINGVMKSGLMDVVDNYFWLAVEKTPPYNLALYEFQRSDMEYFDDVYSHYMARCAKALNTISKMSDSDLSKVPSYGEQADNKFGILPLEIPLWYRSI